MGELREDISGPPLVTVGIPLYRSARFLPSIIENLEALDYSNLEILISDRHCFDDSIGQLRQRFEGDSRFRFLEVRDGLSWVEHFNELLVRARGTFMRWMPHDDVFPRGGLEPLVECLTSRPEVILAYGCTEAIDENGATFQGKSRSNPHPIDNGAPWTFEMCLDTFWRGYFDGAFKGLFRREVVLDAEHMIRPTRDLVWPERAWVFGLILLGRFWFVPESRYVKRFHSESVHARWKTDWRHLVSVTRVMISYVNAYAPSRYIAFFGSIHLMGRCAGRLRRGSRDGQGLEPLFRECRADQERVVLALGQLPVRERERMPNTLEVVDRLMARILREAPQLAALEGRLSFEDYSRGLGAIDDTHDRWIGSTIAELREARGKRAAQLKESVRALRELRLALERAADGSADNPYEYALAALERAANVDVEDDGEFSG